MVNEAISMRPHSCNNREPGERDVDDFCPIKRIDHLELYVGNAKQAAVYYRDCFGFTKTSYRGLETGAPDSASYLMEQGDIRFVLTTPLGPESQVARFVQQHGDGVAVI